MYLAALFRRVLRLRDDTVVPAVCYATCNNAYVEAEAGGLSPALCAPGSPFSLAYEACSSCVIANSDGSAVSTQVYVQPQFAPFVDFCAAQTPVPENATAPAPNATEVAIFSSQLSVLSYIASVASAASSLGLLNATATATVIITVTPSVTSISGTGTIGLAGQVTSGGPTQTPLPKETLTPKPASKTWIAGAIAGPILFFLLIDGIWFFVRRRRRGLAPGPYVTEKAQLHADSVVKPTYELEGEGEVQRISELPAKEPVGNEMDVRRGGERDDG
ncbi:hypothetical protein DL95DRAFT_446140 [Leptodontidium sp. 2 PMI_412]|nr:hypothetical protein DL95DRAFT_446140 [Leptodontidium sp. 2 PMI_412]